MTSTFVDDRDPSVVYSKPASGFHWTDQGSSTSYDDTLSLTRHGGATATLTFTGTSISVYGLISQSGIGSTPSSSYTIDGGTPQVYTAVMTANVQSRVRFFSSNQLSSGQHTLVVTNLAEDDFFWLDYFLITGGAAVTVQDSSVSSSTSSSSTSSSGFVGQLSTAVQTEVVTSEVVSGSSTFTPVSTQMTSSVVSATSRLSPSDASATSGVGTSNSGSGESSSSTAATKIPVGPIVGGIIGVISLLTIIILGVVFFLRRRGKKIPVQPCPPGPSLVVTPFNQPPSVPPPSMSQSSSAGSSPHPYGKFNQQLLLGGNPGAPLLAHLPLAQATGKRQVVVPSNNDHSASSADALHAHLTEDHFPEKSIPQSGTTGASDHGFNGESHQGSSSGTTDVHLVYPMNYPEESPPAYQTGTPMDAERLLVELGNSRHQ